MIMFFVVVGCWAGQTYAEHIHYPDIGVGAWLGTIAGLVFGIVFMLPISNETARWKLKMLWQDSGVRRFTIITGWMIMLATILIITEPLHKVGAGVVGGFGGFFLGIITCVLVENAERFRNTLIKGGGR